MNQTKEEMDDIEIVKLLKEACYKLAQIKPTPDDQCLYCKRQFQSKEERDEHLKIRNIPWINNDAYCRHCPERFCTPEEQRNHSRSYHQHYNGPEKITFGYWNSH